MSHSPDRSCPDCRDGHPVTRRTFVKTTATGLALGAIAGTGLTVPARAKSDAGKKPASETLVQQFYGTLNDEQKKIMAFDFDHALRSEIENNWFITKARFGRDFNEDQHALLVDIFKSLHSEEYVDEVVKQVNHDNGSKNLEKCSAAIFGKPGSGKFELVLTGRHTTRRCDGDSLEGTAFGGPIFYGHAAGSFNEKADHAGNVYWFQAKRANELFQALDGKQRKAALLGQSRGESGKDTVDLSKPKRDIAGLPVGDMSSDQKDLMRKVLGDLLMPFRKTDREETMKLIEANNGFDKLAISYYKNENIGDDEVWDVWQVEGPQMLWYFRGKPHVHTWVHVKQSV